MCVCIHIIIWLDLISHGIHSKYSWVSDSINLCVFFIQKLKDIFTIVSTIMRFSEPPLTTSCNTGYWCKVSILSHFLQGWNNGLLDMVFLTAFHLLHMGTIPPMYSSYQRHWRCFTSFLQALQNSASVLSF